MATIDNKTAVREKRWAAGSSVLAAVGLTVIKTVVGLATGSLGILAEAAHSGLDLVAALITFLAVRISGKPADARHHYGHGKVENLSAFFEILLLLGTCVWIIHEAVDRLFYKSVGVDVSIWAFLVMAISIVVDVSRSRMLYKAARKYRSHALEADALHFSTDIWSSCVVLLGLACVVVAKWVPSLGLLEKADAVAALGVAMIVVFVSIEMGIRTVRILIDTAPKGLAEKIIAAAESVPGVVDCHNVRVRDAGEQLFVDAHASMDGNLTLDEVHALTEKVEQSVQEVVPYADITVHPEPVSQSREEKKDEL